MIETEKLITDDEDGNVGLGKAQSLGDGRNQKSFALPQRFVSSF